MFTNAESIVEKALSEIKEAGLWKAQRVISSRQGVEIEADGRKLLNFCANNYLGLAGRQELVEASKVALEKYGYGMSSVRFICGTHAVHKELEAAMAKYLQKEDAIIFTSCWDANEAIFATLLTDQDAIISDALNHASIIDGVRLCKAERHVFAHMDMVELEEKLKATQEKRLRLVATDGVFSMDGHIAPLKEICDLAEKYQALVLVDDSHATGFMGTHGRGTPEALGVSDRVDIITTTFGKALGGANGGVIAGPKMLVDLLHQRARTTLFTNTLPLVVAATTLFVLEFIEKHPELREELWKNVRYFREKMTEAGFAVSEDVHPIVPVMLGDGKVANDMAREMMDEGIYVIGFSYPVVPLGKARIRVQISAAHSQEQIDKLVEAFTKLGRKYGIVKS
ncbi:glycine C-acetyltransferase [Candidatus Uhrbacteria bacterium]|nr:glycine C-acetyltransferase [Candidatus Uhrbacteria bacterium]